MCVYGMAIMLAERDQGRQGTSAHGDAEQVPLSLAPRRLVMP